MPLRRKKELERVKPGKDWHPDDEVFMCEPTKEVFKNYDDFFARTILCSSMDWTCSITGKTGLTYEEAQESEERAKKRLETMSKSLKRALLYLTTKTRRGRLGDLVDDIYVYAFNRFFIGDLVEAIVQGQWHDCKVVSVLAPSEAEMQRDREEDEEERKAREAEQQKQELDAGQVGSAIDAPKGKKEPKKEKTFFPPDHLFRYKVVKVEPDEDEKDDVYTVNIDCIKREKGAYTREKNLMFLKNMTELGKDGNFCLKKIAKEKYRIDQLQFSDIFSGAEPKFEESKRLKGVNSLQSKRSPENKKHRSGDKAKKHKDKSAKSQGTLDGWVKGDKKSQSTSSLPGAPGSSKIKQKKQSAAEIEADMKALREQNLRFKEEMSRLADEARKKKIEERAKEKERKKEESKLLKELMLEWKKPRDDLLCDDLKELPKPSPVHCKIPNKLFGDFLTLLEFFNAFREVLETHDSFSQGITFEVLEKALTDQEATKGLFDVISFMLCALFDLQDEEDEEVKVDKLTADAESLDKNILGKDIDVASQIKSATQMAQWPMKTQGGQKLRDLHMNEWSLTEILRLHLEAAGAFRSEKLIMWLYQQRGGYRLADDPGLHFRMEEPQILEALNSRTVYEFDVGSKIKILNCLMLQILSFATVRDDIEDKYYQYYEAKSELRTQMISENKRKRQLEEAEKEKRKEERAQKKEEDLKLQEKKEVPPTSEPTKKKEEPLPIEAHMTERQRLAILSKKEAEEREKQKEEESRRMKSSILIKQLQTTVSELAANAGMVLLGRDRAFRRYWLLETLPGIFVEHEDDLVGSCLDQPTPFDENAGPLDEESALKRVREIMTNRGKSPGEEKSSSDKENDQEENSRCNSYSNSKKGANLMKQKVLATKNGTLSVTSAPSTSSTTADVANTETNAVKEEPSEIMEEEPEPKDLKLVSNLPWGACIADNESCPVHSTILPRTTWSYFNTMEQLDDLITNLNPRGFRELELKDKLSSERDRIAKNLKKFQHAALLNSSDDADPNAKDFTDSKTNLTGAFDLTLRDQVLDLEEKIFHGNLGTLKVRSREAWQAAIQNQSYDKQCESLSWGGKSSAEANSESALPSAVMSREGSPSRSEEEGKKRDSTGSETAKRFNKKVRDLACAILQVGQMVNSKYLKLPLGEDEKDKKKRLKEEERRKKERETVEEQPTSNEKAEKIPTPYERWEESLMKCTSYAQLIIHLTTLDNSITWSKSLLNTKCRICRRKTDADKMLLCDTCDRGHHIFCLKPKLKNIPEGNWYCSDCKPKERVRSPKKKSRRVFSTTEESDDDTQEAASQDEEENENVEEDEEESEEESNESEDDDDDAPLTKAKAKAKAKVKKQNTVEPPQRTTATKRKNPPVISQLFGKRRSAAEASEKIARVTQQEIHSGNSSGCESASEVSSNSRTTRATRAKRSLEQAISNGGATQPTSSGSGTRGSGTKRRKALDEDLLGMFNPTGLEDLLNAMMRHRDGWPFDRPITKSDAPDYHKIIKRPMDLGTIRSGINRMKYSCNQEVLEDINLVFQNCYMYNKEDAEEYQCGVRLEKFFKKEARKGGLLGVDYDDDNNEGSDERPPRSKKPRRTL